MTTSRRMVKWSIELNEFSLEFRPRKAIKVQTLTDLIAKCSLCGDPMGPNSKKLTKDSTSHPKPVLKLSNQWLVYIDGLSAQEEAKAGILLIGPDKEELRHCVKFGFPVTNNVAEYKALLSDLNLAKSIKARRIMVYSDSQLGSR